MTPESPDARRIRQAAEWAAFTVAISEEMTLMWSMDPTPEEALGLMGLMAGLSFDMNMRHLREWQPDPPPGGWPGERVVRHADLFTHKIPTAPRLRRVLVKGAE